MKWLKIIFFIFLLLLNFKWVSIAVNEDFQDVVSTIKISVCGDGVIEGSEDCEGEDLNGQTCESLGYGPGTLACDIACSFDTYSCSPAPTPTPTPAPTATPTPTMAVSTSEVTSTSSPAPTTSETVTPTVSQPSATKPALPFFLTPFDPDGDGKIALKEIFIVAKSWVEEWRQALLEEISQGEDMAISKKERKCDLNKDGKCDLIDFSILMSYVER